MASATKNTRKARPLSPHLFIYKPYPTMVMSIVHRMTGAALYFGTILVAWWLVAAASGEAYYDWVNAIFGSFLGRLVLLGYTWALMHHMVGGIRHLIWDTGNGLAKETADKFAYATVIASVVLTILVWVVGFMAR
ncbi:succinate dehydrogenase, cytochrome b556 subunit [Pararhizobium haloflavum]|uniref:succinate dehydrogenase, cytochrome b556 subunit n=1 Tax=Pararhizobium haloflavum TaxID=2037914 RepID=UPI000C1910EA|nr:succinate dehydrogenase, cytochrome b556 subunit [Pararhizobium haloflavum]